MKKLLVFALLACARLVSASGGSTIYVAPAGGLESNIIAAFQKKQVPAVIVLREQDAEYVLRPTAVEIHKESGAGKIARCAFAYCMGIEDSGEVSVQLVEREGSKVVWAYEVAKARAAKNRQSMAEAIAKHLRNEFFSSKC